MEETATTGGKRSAWMVHVKKTMKSHKGMKLGAALKLAAKTYKKRSLRGGADEGVQPYSPGTDLSATGQNAASPTVPAGGRRRKSRKTRRGGAEVMDAGRRRRRHSRKH